MKHTLKCSLLALLLPLGGCLGDKTPPVIETAKTVIATPEFKAVAIDGLCAVGQTALRATPYPSQITLLMLDALCAELRKRNSAPAGLYSSPEAEAAAAMDAVVFDSAAYQYELERMRLAVRRAASK